MFVKKKIDAIVDYSGYLWISRVDYNKKWFALSPLCMRIALLRREKKPIPTTLRRGIRSSRTPFRATWMRSLFRARSRNRLISGRLIPLPCARMTCKEWNPQEHLGPAPWQRIAISAWSASSRSFCARNRKRQVVERRNRP